MSNKKRYSMLASTAAVAFILAACGNGDTADTDDNGVDENGATEEEVEDDANGETADEGPAPIEFETRVENEGEAIEGGTLSIGYVTDSPFTGIFSYELYTGNPDAIVMQYAMGTLVGTDENYQYDDSGAATVDVDQDTNLVTITLRDDVYWHDGEQVTAGDIAFTHEIIGHPDYTGVRYSSDMQSIVGMEAYKNGEADSIEGITVVDDLTLEIQYESVGVQMLQAGGGIWTYAAPRHYLEDIPVAELESAPEIRENPIGFGPFMVDNIVPGESVSYTRFDDYYLGTPNLERIELETVPSSTAVAAMENHQFDLFLSMPTDQYENFEDIPGYTVLGRQENAYTYIGFKLGEWQGAQEDDEGNVTEPAQNVPDPDAKMADVNLRQAMAYAIDNDAVGARFYQGLRSRATSPIIPNFADYYNDDIEGYPYNPDRANELLDEAGYEDTNGDGFRETPDGEELVINFASMSGGDVAEPISEYYMQSWRNIGLNVQLLDGRLHEFNSFYDRVEADDPNIDIYQAAWGTGSDPTPDGLYGRYAPFNYTRWATEENDAFMEDMLSEQGFDVEWRAEVFREWQEYFMEELPIIPTLFRNEVFPVNNRVGAYDITVGEDPNTPGAGIHTWYLIDEDRATE
ncbi:oligopeptide ABC transporter substrate-binding protein [Alkalibacterium pelagium]|uniref:Peptide/nickel transport system substrate-binding protein n=1 Tax=Alkalibacterium pelagium TaxID=426702 RepID=A0A1H7GE46_9LACT|nr:oligopeptide ABC transporter substrate-binding protein [Alkalibacterium pelagium]GEN49824.1 peptide ABC transporter substrate-binding protein [Alkalibacterium pelagium]SEK36523.1 peptide/nickel transport system substrate-binding protein [Alkalibacterium pelagium]